MSWPPVARNKLLSQSVAAGSEDHRVQGHPEREEDSTGLGERKKNKEAWVFQVPPGLLTYGNISCRTQETLFFGKCLVCSDTLCLWLWYMGSSVLHLETKEEFGDEFSWLPQCPSL
jgi:hypothetical protein